MGSRLYRFGRYLLPLRSSLSGPNDCFLCAQIVFLNTSDGCTSYSYSGCGTASHRLFSSSTKCLALKVSSDNPYEVLGVSNTATYTQVKKRFLELAMKHHPDRAANENSSSDDNVNKQNGVKDFIRFRQAFERIQEDANGMTTVGDGDDASHQWTDEEFNAWYSEETGRDSSLTFRLDMKTRQEVIDVVKKQAQGGLDRGGIWEWARRLAEEDEIMRENTKKFKRKVGISAEPSTSSSNLRRRRKK